MSSNIKNMDKGLETNKSDHNTPLPQIGYTYKTKSI